MTIEPLSLQVGTVPLHPPWRHSPAFEHLLEIVEKSLPSANSRRAYRTSLLQFLAWCNGHSGLSFTRSTVLQYRDALIVAVTEADGERVRRYAPSTVNVRLAAVRALAQEAADADLLSQGEAAAIKRVRGERVSGNRMGNWLGKDEVDRVLRSIDRSTLRGRRDYAVLAVLFVTGLRRRELVDLDVGVIQERDGQWGLIGIQGKGGRIRNISLPVWVKTAVDEWMGFAGVLRGPIFRSISRHGKLGAGRMADESVKLILSYSMSKCGHPLFRPHDARRTCARLCRASHASLEDIQELLGHSSIQTTERYLGKTDGFKRAITNCIKEPGSTV